MQSFYSKIMSTADRLDSAQIMSEVEFKGFDPIAYTDTIMTDPLELSLKIGVVGALRGGNWKKIKDTHIDFASVGYVENISPGQKNPTVKTILRTTAVLAPEIAHFLERDPKLKKRIKDSVVPACLQFPAAACVIMGPKARDEHIKFCKAFSALLPSGDFNMEIYRNMMKTQRDMKAQTEHVLEFLAS
jgi:hypothetical protein